MSISQDVTGLTGQWLYHWTKISHLLQSWEWRVLVYKFFPIFVTDLLRTVLYIFFYPTDNKEKNNQQTPDLMLPKYDWLMNCCSQQWQDCLLCSSEVRTGSFLYNCNVSVTQACCDQMLYLPGAPSERTIKKKKRKFPPGEISSLYLQEIKDSLDLESQSVLWTDIRI